MKVPTILQMEATECGAASLAMILAHYGLWIPLEKLRRNCEVHGYRWEDDDIREEGEFPMIIHCEFNHFLVLEGIIGDTFYLNDPAMGRRTVEWDEFLTSYTGISITVAPGENFKPVGQKYSVVKGFIKNSCKTNRLCFS